MRAHRVFPALTCVAAALLAAPPETGAGTAPADSSKPNVRAGIRPNFLFILSDDQGLGDLSRNGNTALETPRLDALAGQSVVLKTFYASPACAPSRAALLTGRNFLRTGVWEVHAGAEFLDLRERTLAEALRAAGYATAIFGKWHNGSTAGYGPLDRGFDHALITRDYVHLHPPVVAELSSPGAPDRIEGWNVKRLTDETLRWIAQQPEDKPWFVFFTPQSPHSPWEAPDDLIRKYRERGHSGTLAAYFAMVEQLDREVGRLLDELGRRNLDERTVVIFASDNGPVWNTPGPHQGELTPAEIALRNAPGFRGGKGNVWEQGCRVPCFVRWTGHLPPREVREPTMMEDLAPTILEIAGATPPPDARPFDGISLVPVLEGRSPLPERRLVLTGLGLKPGARAGKTVSPGFDVDAERAAQRFSDLTIAVRRGPWKFVQSPDHKADDLFAPERDPSERKGFRSEAPDVYENLRAEASDWHDALKRSGTAYQMPVFLLKGGPNVRVRANAAARLTGDFRAEELFAPFLTAGKPGSSARYRIKVIDPSIYRIGWVGKMKEQGRIRLTLGRHSLEALLKPGEGAQPLGTLEAFKDDTTLEVELLEGAIDAWNELIFHKAAGNSGAAPAPNA